ncbi:MAG: ABC transporter ATP-binding protein [Deltaproteobacteria bacterium]|nr:ABC transporter ATP-binding protein [Deltaproteobacteria bacterium]MBW2072622.1 ABC transporter ATP-binding protein [Deltaproteobacteria bacterium]
MKLEVRDLHAAYQQDLFVLRGLDLSVAQGEISIVIGPNGSGKSTLLKSIAGVLKPQKGAVWLDEEEITGINLDEIIKRGICYIPQDRAVFPQMTVTENLELGCWVFKRDRKRVRDRIEWALERFPVLKDRRKLQVGSLSGGLQRILDIAKSLLANPMLLLVDEPAVGLAPIVAQSIYSELAALKEEGRTILLVDQDVRSAMEIADMVTVLDLGRVQAHGSKADFEGKLSEIVSSWLL